MGDRDAPAVPGSAPPPGPGDPRPLDGPHLRYRLVAGPPLLPHPIQGHLHLHQHGARVLRGVCCLQLPRLSRAIRRAHGAPHHVPDYPNGLDPGAGARPHFGQRALVAPPPRLGTLPRQEELPRARRERVERRKQPRGLRGGRGRGGGGCLPREPPRCGGRGLGDDQRAASAGAREEAPRAAHFPPLLAEALEDEEHSAPQALGVLRKREVRCHPVHRSQARVRARRLYTEAHRAVERGLCGHIAGLRVGGCHHQLQPVLGPLLPRPLLLWPEEGAKALEPRRQVHRCQGHCLLLLLAEHRRCGAGQHGGHR
mmetsp:Transcript_2909/g.7401  ORF Transcript_2909/g.7401 Transcript_2909/m.7401 type:complete len:312 (+) Transcript_2909:276-1211(+)